MTARSFGLAMWPSEAWATKGRYLHQRAATAIRRLVAAALASSAEVEGTVT
jgi:hypothetical protein